MYVYIYIYIYTYIYIYFDIYVYIIYRYIIYTHGLGNFYRTSPPNNLTSNHPKHFAQNLPKSTPGIRRRRHDERNAPLYEMASAAATI